MEKVSTCKTSKHLAFFELFGRFITSQCCSGPAGATGMFLVFFSGVELVKTGKTLDYSCFMTMSLAARRACILVGINRLIGLSYLSGQIDVILHQENYHCLFWQDVEEKFAKLWKNFAICHKLSGCKQGV